MVTSGFYDSFKHDRKYNALQFGSIFDGIIRDGIYMSIGTCFRVVPNVDMVVSIGTGRGWFNHTWILNDAPLPIPIPQSEIMLNRIDAIVIDINSSQEVRKNDIILIKGTPATNPERPTLINDQYRHQYPLAYIEVRAEVTSIRDADITSMIGTSETPYVTGILETVNIDALLDQWRDQWNRFFEEQTAFSENQWNEWFINYTKQLDEFTDKEKQDFLEWFDGVKDVLTGDQAGNLLNLINKIKDSITSIYNNLSLYSIGDYCYKDNVLYKCTTEITVPEEWDGTHWKTTTISSELKSVKDTLTGSILNTMEEINANTAPDNFAGALALKELNSKLGDQVFFRLEGTTLYIETVKGGS